ncbi:hypothetical protein DLJ53_18025 [Acuticoccus sediminis]|uniref:Uncharacterized protein n=1 Tax=Acuticoccus sediminis TaxID=2184697 RepID=A0A8B2NUG8_9HYPH|nr:hypothetical protein DLJ53_18025 [Acuticoccus sediminis]
MTAAPWGQRRLYEGTFMKGGAFPNRKTLALGGHVFERTVGRKFRIVKSGLRIPDEMIKGATLGAWEDTAGLLPERVERIITKTTNGLISAAGSGRGRRRR